MFTSLSTVVVLVLLTWLGRWQLQRADEKRALFDEFARGSDATRTIDAATPLLPRYAQVAAQGRYDGSRQVLIDNMFDAAGHAGYYVITPFALTGGGWLLVNRGWVPVGAQRAQLPRIDVADGIRLIRGRADNLPSPGIRLGVTAPLQGPYPVVSAFPTHVELEHLLGESSWSPAAQVMLLDAGQPDGYVREWQAPGLPPLRHVAYAVQWFGLALALLVIYVVTNLRKPLEAGALS